MGPKLFPPNQIQPNQTKLISTQLYQPNPPNPTQTSPPDPTHQTKPTLPNPTQSTQRKHQVCQPKHQVCQPKHQIHQLKHQIPKTPKNLLPNIDLRCFVAKHFLSRIY